MYGLLACAGEVRAGRTLVFPQDQHEAVVEDVAVGRGEGVGARGARRSAAAILHRTSLGVPPRTPSDQSSMTGRSEVPMSSSGNAASRCSRSNCTVSGSARVPSRGASGIVKIGSRQHYPDASPWMKHQQVAVAGYDAFGADGSS